MRKLWILMLLFAAPTFAADEYFARDTTFNVPRCVAVLVKTKQAMVMEGELKAAFYYERMAQRLVNVLSVFTSPEDITEMYVVEMTALEAMLEADDAAGSILQATLRHGIWCSRVARDTNPAQVVRPEQE